MMLDRFPRIAHLFRPDSPWRELEPIRGDILSPERLEEHAAALAATQSITTRRVRQAALRVRLRHNELVLLKAYHCFSAAAEHRGPVMPAAEWLLDNYHIVEEQIREIRQDLPPGFYRQLPKLAAGRLAGYPRVFGVAWDFVAHTDSRFEPELLKRFLRAYQTVSPLTIGELWAVAITLRVALVENLRRCAEQSMRARTARADADKMADRLVAGRGGAIEEAALLELHSSRKPLGSAYAAQLILRLRDQDPQVTPARVQLTQRLALQGTTHDELIAEEHRRQSTANVTVRNIITSMRLMSDVDWAELFESVSLVESRLRTSPVYPSMDFVTRNLYRSAVEDLARRSPLSEIDIATRALASSIENNAAEDTPARSAVETARHGDPGYRLLGPGKFAFQKAIGYRLPFLHRPRQFMMQRGTFFYLSGVGVLSAATLSLPLFWLWAQGIAPAALLLLGVLGLIPATDIAVGVVNRFVNRRVGATVLPSLALRDGVPDELRTMIVVPILLTTCEAIIEHIERLEIHHLASLAGALHFALLADGKDASSETAAGDDRLLAAAEAGISSLNVRYPAVSGAPRFFLLHRRRVWNESEQQWMGWERKRGKLHELNRLLRGATDTTFVGKGDTPPFVPPRVRFIITLDADTRLPRDTARRLIGKLSHPLNRPRFDPSSGRVVEGYAILQPRVTASLPTGLDGSRFQKIFSNSPGIDPYSAAASDLYQDLFGEGSYAGKGIYDVDAFEAALTGRVPASSLLSHDLFEGLFARAGLASDVEVIEDYPERYDVATQRQHRWVRGDWQLLPWIVGRDDRGSCATGLHHTLPMISVWKMVDNLRRSLSAPAALAALVVGWTLPLRGALLWSGFIALAVCLQALLPLLQSIVPRRAGTALGNHFLTLARDTRLAFAQSMLLLIFLAHLASLMIDAIGRSLFRVFFSHRNLLQWVTAAQLGSAQRTGWAGLFRYMGFAVVLSSALLLVAAARSISSWPVIVPFAILWLISPIVAQWVSRAPKIDSRFNISAADERAMRLVARRTWRFFETFVGPSDNMLPPDNVQEDPHRVVAHRTSPTNLGLYLISVLSARDFGWIGAEETVERLEATMATMSRMQLYRGHFLNWYDTRDLRPLEPAYVSTVDSGNLCAHLLVLGMACRESRLPRPAWQNGSPSSLTHSPCRKTPRQRSLHQRLRKLTCAGVWTRCCIGRFYAPPRTP